MERKRCYLRANRDAGRLYARQSSTARRRARDRSRVLPFAAEKRNQIATSANVAHRPARCRQALARRARPAFEDRHYRRRTNRARPGGKTLRSNPGRDWRADNRDTTTAREPRMTDAQLTAILTSIADALESTASVNAVEFREDVRAIRGLIAAAAAETTKPVPFGGSGTVSV